RIWDASTGQPITAPLVHGAAVSHLRLNPDGTRVLSVANSRSVRLWNARSGALLLEWAPHSTSCADALFNADGRLILTVSDRGSVRVWHTDTGTPAADYFSGTNLFLNSRPVFVQFSPDGGTLLTATEDNTVRLWDTRTGARLGEPMRHRERITVAKFSPDGTRVATGS